MDDGINVSPKPIRSEWRSYAVLQIEHVRFIKLKIEERNAFECKLKGCFLIARKYAKGFWDYEDCGCRGRICRAVFGGFVCAES